ncbi:MAG: glutathione S-transferase family protein [Alphaproteobacteria bacterium]|nr:glutathione S-transferase family protein [Alphaproteobacteria bacterium]
MGYILYGDCRSGAFAAECALCEAGAEYEFSIVSLQKEEQRKPEFLAINPTGKMPALRLPEGAIVAESLAILLAVADRHPAAGLLPPPASDARAQCYRWLAFMATEIYPMVEIVDYPERFAHEETAALKQRAIERIRERLLILEAAVHGPWLLGGNFSLADIYAAMFIRWSIGSEWRNAHLPNLVGLSRNLREREKIAPVWARHFASPT